MLNEDEKWFRVSLRLVGDGFDPRLVETHLGLAPDLLGIKGQPRVGKDGQERAPYQTNLWGHTVNVSAEIGFDEQIRAFFERLGDHMQELRSLCETEGVYAELFCGFGSGNGQGGDTILPSTLKLLADSGLSLGLDLYPPDVDEKDT